MKKTNGKNGFSGEKYDTDGWGGAKEYDGGHGKALAVLFGVFCVIAVLGFIIASSTKVKENDGGDTVATGSGNFFRDDWEADFDTPLEEYDCYEEYREKDCDIIHWKQGSETVGLTDEDREGAAEDISFFFDYFDTVKAGDSVKYNTFFSSVYLEKYGEKASFTPQMIYDITVEKVAYSMDNGTDSYEFIVYYKIFHNNRTFRDDIYSDAERAVNMKLDNSEGKLKIYSLKYYDTTPVR